MSKANFQTRTVLIVKFLIGEVGEDLERGSENAAGKGGKKGIVGKITLFNREVKRNDGGKTALVTVCKSEEERLKVFEEQFGIHLTAEEIQGVKGRNVELKDE